MPNRKLATSRKTATDWLAALDQPVEIKVTIKAGTGNMFAHIEEETVYRSYAIVRKVTIGKDEALVEFDMDPLSDVRWAERAEAEGLDSSDDEVAGVPDDFDAMEITMATPESSVTMTGKEFNEGVANVRGTLRSASALS